MGLLYFVLGALGGYIFFGAKASTVPCPPPPDHWTEYPPNTPLDGAIVDALSKTPLVGGEWQQACVDGRWYGRKLVTAGASSYYRYYF